MAKYQTVIIMLDDGRSFSYVGKAHPDVEGRKVVKVIFVEPQELPADCRFETLDEIHTPMAAEVPIA